jgi:hypothetical protein
MVNDHEAITITKFRGLFDRGDDESTPRGFFRTSQNNRYIQNGFKSREGSSSIHTISSVRRIAAYRRFGEAPRVLILDGTGKLFDSTNLAAAILNIPAMTDFSVVSLFNRAYITPHNGVTGLAGEKVYVYNGSGTARAAAGVAPTGFSLTATNSALAGNCESGVHLIAVCFQTDSGFITAPGAYISFNFVGGKKLSIGNIGVGGAGTSKRVLLSTKIIPDFNGDFLHQTYYFIPGGTINDNVSTSLNDTLSFYDADLEEDASYLLDQLDVIPAGVGIGSYNAHMTVWGEDSNSSVVRVSKAGQPESISAVDGFITVNPGDAGDGVKNCWEYRKQLISQKSQRSYISQDNGAAAAFWACDELDDSVGSEPHAVGTVLDFGNIVADTVLSAHITGLRLYNGSFNTQPLTYSIGNIWARINKAAFKTVEVALNPLNFEIFIAVPLDGATTPNTILYGDYTDGLTPEEIKWDIWKFPRDPQTVLVDVNSTTREAVVKFGTLAGNVYKLDTTQTSDFGSVISAFGELGYLPEDVDDTVKHFGGARVRAKGSGTLRISAHGLDGVPVTPNFDNALSLTPGKPIFQGFDLSCETAALKVATVNTNDYYLISKISLYANELWQGR